MLMKKVFKTMAFTLLGLVLSVNLMAASKTVTLTNAQIVAGSGGTSYGNCSATDGAGNTWNAYAIKNHHSAATSDYKFWQIKKYASSTAYYVQVPEMPGEIQSLTMTVSSTQQPMTGGGNSVTLYFSSSNSTSAAGTGIASGTGASSVTINASSLKLKEGYITASGAVRIWDVEVTYESGDTPTPTDPSLSVSPTTIDFGTVAVGGSVDAQDVTATLTNTDYAIATLSGTNADAFEITAGEKLTETGTITVRPTAATLAVEGTYSATLEVEADGVDGTKTVSLSLKVVKPFTGNTWTLDKDDFTTGSYGSGTKTVDDIEISYADVYQNSSAIQFKKTSGVIYNTTDFGKIEKIEITKTGNNNLNVYPGTSSNPTENAILGVASGNVTTYTFPTDENYGYFAIGKGSGASNVTPIKVFYYPIKSDITIDNTCANGSVSVTSPTVLTQVASGTEITLSNTPASGYKLDAYKVYKTGDESTTVTVKEDGTFTMPAYGVTVSATFSLSIETPVLSEVAGDKNDAINVKVTNYNGDYSYYYTLDGIDPTNASTPYVDADGIDIDASCTLKVIAYKGEVTSSVASAAYNLPLMTMDAIFAKATAVGSTATAVRVKFSDCVVTGVSGDNVYLTDNAGKGLIIYQSSHGFAVNDKLNGVVNVQLLLYKGSSEIKGLTSSTDGLTVTKDGEVTPITTIDIADLNGVNTGAVLSYESLIYDGTDKVFSDGENTIQPYNTFKIADYPDFADGDKYNVTGVYIQYNTTKEIAPRSLADLEKIEAQKYAINLSSVEHGSISTTPETEAADGTKVTLSATPDAGYMLGEWSVKDADGATIAVSNNEFKMPAMAVTVSATFVELPIWATTYTSNVTLSGNKVKLAEEYQPADYPEDGYDAKKDGSSGAKASISVKVPANTTGLHYHLFAWNGEGGKTVSIKKGETVLATFTNIADEGISGSSSTYTLQNNPVDAYGYVALEGITEETTITFSTPANSNRICLFGVNAIQPASITIAPAEKNFGEVKANSSSEPFEFTIDPNDFVEGTPEIEIIGEDAAWFSYTAITDNAFTVTFSPKDEKEVCSATLNIKLGNEVMCSASLTGKAISATTPTIDVDKENIDFGTKKQGESFELQTVAVTLNYLSAATVAVTGNFEVTPTSLTESGTVTVSVKSTTDADTFDGELTISGDGASDKVVSLHAVVADKWATTYSSNINDINDFNIEVVVEEVSYEDSGIKIGSSGKGGSVTVKIPEGTEKLHFHVAAWKDKSTGMTVKMGETTLREIASTDIPSEAGVSGSGSTFTLVGNTSTDQYFNIDLSGYTIEENTEITFTTSSERVVLYGVNQEGGVTTVLQSIEIQGTATALNYEIGQTFVPTGLKVVGTFKKGDAEPTTRDLTNAEFDWSFDPAQFNEENESASVIVTATAKENTEVTANKTIENIVVIAPVVEITTTTTKVDFGTVAQNATIDNELVYITFKNCTEASVALSGDDADKFTIDAETVEAGDFNWVTVGVAEGTTATAGEYVATLTIHAEGAKADIVLPVTLIVEAPETCDGSDDFATVEAVSSYGDRTTTAGWTATNTRVDVVDDYTYFTMNGKTTAAGVITSPVLSHGISTLKFRYGNIAANDTKYKVQIDIKQGEDIVKTYEVSKEGISKGDIFTETITNINVAGDYQIIFTNKCPSESSSNADRAAIGRLCITEYADYARSELTIDNYGTICLPNAVEEVTGAVFYSIVGYQGAKENPSGIVIESVVDELVAGMPYIFKATANQITVTYKGGAVTAPVTNDNKAAANGLIGSFVETKLNAGYYGIQNNALVMVVDADVWVDANRAYIDMEYMSSAADAPAPAPGVRRVAMSNSSYSAPTNLNGLNGNVKAQKVMKDGQLYIIRDTKMYNAQGQLVK